MKSNSLGINGIKTLCTNMEKLTKLNTLQLFLDKYNPRNYYHFTNLNYRRNLYSLNLKPFRFIQQ